MPLYQQGGLLGKNPDLSGLGKGLSNAVQMYYEQKELKRQRELQNQQLTLAKALQEWNMQQPEQELNAANADIARMSRQNTMPTTGVNGVYQGVSPVTIPPRFQSLQMAQAYGKSLMPQESESGSDELNRLRVKILSGMTPDEQKAYLTKPSNQTTVNLDTNAQKTTLGALESEILDVDKTIDQLKQSKAQHKPEYSEWAFRGKQALTTGLEKAGIEPPSKEGLVTLSKKQIGDYTDWFQNAEASFLSFRKWATGVAGGQAEMAQIREAFPEPRNLSATQFMSAVDNAIKYREAYKAKLEQYRLNENVLSDNQKKFITQEVLKEIKPNTPIEAINPTTGEEIRSLDGGKTWQPIK